MKQIPKGKSCYLDWPRGECPCLEVTALIGGVIYRCNLFGKLCKDALKAHECINLCPQIMVL